VSAAVGAHRIEPRGRSPVVVFDVGGVIVNWRPLDLMRRHFPDHARDEAGARVVLEQVSQSFAPHGDWGAFDRGEVEPAALARRIAARTALPLEGLEALIAGIPSHLQPMDESVALVARVRAAGHRLGILSNMPAPYAEHLEREHAVFGAFDHRTWSGRLGFMKPQREIFDSVRDAMGIDDLSQAVFVDDHPGNVEAAKAYGWQAVRFENAPDCALELERLGFLA
jgi:putative hydrolase of the HAD superfamily